ncbi:MAG: GIY-YIG nuclease family protein [Candidatus Omnitrophica bacterium]|nr:GIY-YIG nuclease family protein [Candidatus Omnitrophota bacterium]
MKKRIKRSGNFFVYILRCRDGSYYTGYTNDLEARLIKHNSGRGSKCTRSRLPVSLVWSREYRYFKSAISMERQIKSLTRKQKELIVKGISLFTVLKEP